jgi:hypothetical protein
VADPYLYGGTTVLRNLAGLRDADKLAEHEAQASTLRLAQLAAVRIEGAYDLPHLQAFHHFIFQDIYAWAGELRSVDLAKPGSMFALPEYINGYLTDVLWQLADEEHLRGLTRATSSRSGSPTTTPRSTRFIPFERATDEHSGPSCVSWRWTPTTLSPGSTSIRPRSSTLRSEASRETTCQCSI